MKTPPCAKWDTWTGPEIEGSKYLGVKTLFIRRSHLKPKSLVSAIRAASFRRIWFCKEFLWNRPKTEQTKIFGALSSDYDLAFELTFWMKDMAEYYRKYGTVYFKLETYGLIKPGDFLCVGPAFKDEAFLIGTGNKVAPTEYLSDRKIKL